MIKNLCVDIAYCVMREHVLSFPNQQITSCWHQHKYNLSSPVEFVQSIDRWWMAFSLSLAFFFLFDCWPSVNNQVVVFNWLQSIINLILHSNDSSVILDKRKPFFEKKNTKKIYTFIFSSYFTAVFFLLLYGSQKFKCYDAPLSHP